MKTCEYLTMLALSQKLDEYAPLFFAVLFVVFMWYPVTETIKNIINDEEE